MAGVIDIKPMVFGMTRGEIGLVLFIFALVWGAGVLPRIGEWIGTRIAKKKG